MMLKKILYAVLSFIATLALASVTAPDATHASTVSDVKIERNWVIIDLDSVNACHVQLISKEKRGVRVILVGRYSKFFPTESDHMKQVIETSIHKASWRCS